MTHHNYFFFFEKTIKDLSHEIQDKGKNRPCEAREEVDSSEETPVESKSDSASKGA